jgi:hypothetical protein
VDVVLVHQEFYGLPWDSFEAGTSPPAEWVAVMDDLAARAQAVGPVFLSLQLVSGPGRRFLADRAVVVNDALSNPSGMTTECYDFSTAPDGASKRAAYVAYVDWMVRRFQPRWVNVAIEMNLFTSCGDGPWNALVEVERAAYASAKAARPGVLAFPSIQIDLLYGWGPDCPPPADRDTCFDTSYARLANVARDRFAVSSLPYIIKALENPAAVPAGWFTRAGDRGGERTVVAETGWLGTPMVVEFNGCLTAITSGEDAQLAWFDRLMDETRSHNLELVTWVSNRDLVSTAMMTDCPCSFDPAWCGFLADFRQSAGADLKSQADAEFGIKEFGSMGLRQYDGTPRQSLYARWQAARALPWAGKP